MPEKEVEGMNLNSYMDTFFPKLKLQKPLFYNWKYGLRFEIGLESLSIMKDSEKGVLNLEYFQKALNRAKELFQYVFDEDDEMILVCQRYSENRQKIKKYSFCFTAIKNIKQKKVESFKLRDLYVEDGYDTKQEHWHRIAVHLRTCELDYTDILRRLTYTDFGAYGPEVYFIHKNKNIIFNLYDDRGLDIIAAQKEDLEDIYQKFNSWILEYDRQEIDRMMKQWKKGACSASNDKTYIAFTKELG